MSASVELRLTAEEAIHFGALLRQFLELLEGGGGMTSADPALDRLTPDPYPDDAEAAREFRSLTRSDLLARRRQDVQRLLAQLANATPLGEESDAAGDELALSLGPDDQQAWLRTLAALRLVLAGRLEIASEDDERPEDPRYAVYDWLGLVLEGLIRAVEHAG